nr:hypothetical protein [Tanacetum cinerariifolium]
QGPGACWRRVIDVVGESVESGEVAGSDESGGLQVWQEIWVGMNSTLNVG